MNLQIYLLLAVTLAAGLCLNVVKNVFCKKYQRSISDTYMYSVVNGIFAVLTVALISGGKISVSSATLFYAVIYGLNWVLLAVVNNLALKTGPLSYTSVIVSLSLVIPTFSGWIFWNEKINALQLIGIIFMIMCFVLSNEKSGDDKKAKKIWYVYVAVAFVSNGLCGIIQKLHQSSSGAEETTGFVFTALLISVIISTPLMLFFKGKERKNRPSESSESLKTDSKTKYIVLFLLLAAGVCSGLVNQINLYLVGIMDSAVFFPVVNGGNLILTMLLSVTAFKEKPTSKQWLGLAMGMTAVIMLCV